LAESIKELQKSVAESMSYQKSVAEKTSNMEFRQYKESGEDFLGAVRSLESWQRGDDPQASREHLRVFMRASQGIESTDFCYAGFHYKNDLRRANWFAICVWLLTHDPSDPGWELFECETTSPGLTGTVIKYSQDIRRMCIELWQEEHQDPHKVEELVANMEQKFGKLASDLLAMLELLEPCSPSLVVQEASEHVKMFMLPDRIKQSEQPAETPDTLAEKLKQTPKKVQTLFQMYQEKNERGGKSLKVQFTEFLIELHQWLACAQAAKVCKTCHDFYDQCEQAQKDSQSNQEMWNKVVANDKIFKVGMPRMAEHIQALKDKCRAKGIFNEVIKGMKSKSWYIAAQLEEEPSAKKARYTAIQLEEAPSASASASIN